MTPMRYLGEAMSRSGRSKSSAYWRANITLIRNLLLIWAFVSIGCSILFVELLNNIQFGGVPFGFWMAQQGSIYVFVVLIFIYAVQMDKLDRRFSQMPDQRPGSDDRPPN